MKTYIVILVAGVVFLAPSAFAAGYGDAGCGLGSLIFGDSPSAMAQTSAGTTNGTSSTQPFGISSGTSNCDTTGIVLAEKAPEVFVAKNFASLAKEMAAGQGEHLVTLAGLLGCSSEATAPLGRYTQQNYETIVSDEAEPGLALEAVQAGIAGDPVLSASCRN